MTSDALLEADRLDTDPRTREHVTPFIRESGRFRVEPVTNDEDLSSVRWTVDTAADLDGRPPHGRALRRRRHHAVA